MCGLSGFLSKKDIQFEYRNVLGQMSDVISHRGPDDSGIWFDEAARIGLAHRRLAIVDLSAAGHQPMTSATGRFVIAFNGEIYNHQELRDYLHSINISVNWRGQSDTETLLACFDALGIQNTLQRAVGMFAFAVWDKKAKTLTLARDRLGEKPLYYGWEDEAFIFGSELKSLKSFPNFKCDIDRGAVSLFLRHSYIPAPYSIYKNVKKLMPGTILEISTDNFVESITSYWSIIDVAEKGAADLFDGTEADVVEQVEYLLKSSIRNQMIADVPLGAFLSGGIDSSTVVSLMQSMSINPIRTFTIGFSEAEFNEAVYAKDIAHHLGTDHTELYILPEDALNVIPRLPYLYDEPFADPSQIPTFLVSQLARQHVTVCLSGDAGDELFCGYNRYKFTSNLWGTLQKIPLPLRKIMAKGLTAISTNKWDFFGDRLPKRFEMTHMGDKIHKGARVLDSISSEELYYRLVSHTQSLENFVIDGREPATFLKGNTPNFYHLPLVEQMMTLDKLIYLPDDILVKVDRAAMGVSLETRVPFLDHRLVEFAARLPLSMKSRGKETKWPLRQILYEYVPRNLIERPKMGFGVPIASWLRGPLKAWVTELLDETRLKNEGIFYPNQIQLILREHLSGERNWGYLLWNIVMFQAWLDAQK